MNSQDREHEAQLQAAAEQAERSGQPTGDSAVDAYRLVIRAVRQAPMPALPEDFARRVAARVSPAADKASMEDGMASLLLLGMALGGGGYFLPRFWPLLSSLPLGLPALNLPAVSWPLLIAAAAGIGLAWAIDRLWDRRSEVLSA
jgi:hypothetical protein